MPIGSIGVVNYGNVGAFAGVENSKIATINGIAASSDSVSINRTNTILFEETTGTPCNGDNVITVTSSGTWTATKGGTNASRFSITPTSGSSGQTCTAGSTTSVGGSTANITFTVGGASTDINLECNLCA